MAKSAKSISGGIANEHGWSSLALSTSFLKAVHLEINKMLAVNFTE